MNEHRLLAHLSGFILLAIGIVVPMTVPASRVVLAVFWCVIVAAALIWAATFPPIARPSLADRPECPCSQHGP
ncbi:MAG: hypothetical protein U0S48_13675 [Solirubrobacteraceae bacterium]